MLKMISGILRLSVLLVVSMALVGVNIAQLYCMCCDKTHLQVELLPQENGFLCETEEHSHEKSCCPLPDKEDSHHYFYKVTGFLQLVKNILPEIIFLDFGSGIGDMPLLFAQVNEHRFLYPPRFIPDQPPSLEFLCIYLC